MIIQSEYQSQDMSGMTARDNLKRKTCTIVPGRPTASENEGG